MSNSRKAVVNDKMQSEKLTSYQQRNARVADTYIERIPCSRRPEERKMVALKCKMFRGTKVRIVSKNVIDTVDIVLNDGFLKMEGPFEVSPFNVEIVSDAS